MPEDGIYQESLIRPVQILEDKEDSFTTLVGDDGRRVKVEKRGARSSVYLYLRGKHKLKRPEVWDLDPEKRSDLLTRNLKEYEEDGKARTFKLIFADDGSIDAVVTDQHKQIPYSDIKGIVEEAIREAVPDAQFYDRGIERYWTYSLPVHSNYVRSYVGIDAGVNKPKGRCAVYIYTRFEVVYAGKEGQRAPCHNWAYWFRPAKFFGIDLNKMPIPEPYRKLDDLSAKAVHVQGTEIQKDDIKTAIKTIMDSADIIDPIIEDAMNVRLDKKEMEAILSAYEETVGLPKYLKEMIMENVEDMDLWGLSNAVSWVRTHGELKKGQVENREERPIISRLENIAGELMTLGPAVREIKKRIPGHKITADILLKPEEALFSKKVEEELAKAEQKPKKRSKILTGDDIFRGGGE